MHTRRSGHSSARIVGVIAGLALACLQIPGTGTRGHGASRGGTARQPADGIRRCASDGADQRSRVVTDGRRQHRVRRRAVHERATGRRCAGRQHGEPQQPARVRHPDRRTHQLLGPNGQRHRRRRHRVSRWLSDLYRWSVHQRQRADEEPDRGSQPHDRRRHPAFAASSDARVRAIAATATTVYFGGLVTNVNGAARSRVAAVRASDGAVLPWAPVAAGGSVTSVAVSPDSSKVLVGGSFTTMNGSGDPGYGMAAVDATSGLSLPWAANATVRNGGPNAAADVIAIRRGVGLRDGLCLRDRRQSRGHRENELERRRGRMARGLPR